MPSKSSPARPDSSGTLFWTTRRPTASQPLSTDDSQLRNVATRVRRPVVELLARPVVVPVPVLAAERAVHRLERGQRLPERARRARGARSARAGAATTALHMYAPMFVVDVCTLRVPSYLSESAGSPVRSSVIATNDAHVPRAYSRNLAIVRLRARRRDQHQQPDQNGSGHAPHEAPPRGQAVGVPYPPGVSGNPSYADLAAVYEWLTPEPLLTPGGQRRRVRALDRPAAGRRARARLRGRGRACWRSGSRSGVSRPRPPTSARR